CGKEAGGWWRVVILEHVEPSAAPSGCGERRELAEASSIWQAMRLTRWAIAQADARLAHAGPLANTRQTNPGPPDRGSFIFNSVSPSARSHWCGRDGGQGRRNAGARRGRQRHRRGRPRRGGGGAGGGGRGGSARGGRPGGGAARRA